MKQVMKKRGVRKVTFVRDHLSRRSLYQLNGSDLHMMEIMPSSVHW